MVTAAPQQDILLDTARITYLPDGYVLFSPTDLFPTTTDWQSYQHLLNRDRQLVYRLWSGNTRSGQISVADATINDGQHWYP